MNEGYPFNVRVYGLLPDSSDRFLLLSEERIQGKLIIKFPGGGLQYGEGPEDCVVREYFEETGIRTEVSRHFYTTGFFQASAFEEDMQVISIYYLLRSTDPAYDKPFPREGDAGSSQANTDKERFFWKAIDRIGVDDFDLPIDQKVAEMVRQELIR